MNSSILSQLCYPPSSPLGVQAMDTQADTSADSLRLINAAWRSQETARAGHHRSRPIGREATARHLLGFVPHHGVGLPVASLPGGQNFAFSLMHQAAKIQPVSRSRGAAYHRPTPECLRPTTLSAIATRQNAHPLRPLHRPLRC